MQKQAVLPNMNLSQRINTLLKKIKLWKSSSSYQQICRQYKSLSAQLMNYINLYMINSASRNDLQKEMRQIIQMITMLVQSSQYQKFGHSFPLLRYMIRKYHQLVNEKKVHVNANSVFKRLIKNQQSNIYNQQRIMQISHDELQFTKLQKYNSFIDSVSSGHVILPNNQCICCSRVFFRDLEFTNLNNNIANIIGVSQRESLSTATLEKYICSLYNQRGGVILIGAQKTKYGIRAKGINFNTNEEVVQRKNQIASILNQMKHKQIGRSHFLVQEVLVHHNSISKQYIERQQLRYCFRITVIPDQCLKICYIQTKRRGYHYLYDIYKFDSSYKPKKIVSEKNPNSKVESVYSFIHKKFYQEKRNQSSQKNIHINYSCYKPRYKDSKEFLQYAETNSQILRNQTQFISNNTKEQDELKFSFSFTTILVVGSRKKKKFIQDIKIFMKGKRYLFQIIKPYENEFKEGGRYVCLINHEDAHAKIKNVVKECDTAGHITVIPLHKTIEIARCKLIKETQNKIKEKYCKKFDEASWFLSEIEKIDFNQDKIKMVEIKFDNYSQAVYAYLLFQQAQLRPYLIKDNTTYIKKSKIKMEQLTN